MSIAKSGGDQTLTESDGVAWVEIAWAWRWIICSMKLYDEIALEDDVPEDDVLAGADVIETLDPSA